MQTGENEQALRKILDLTRLISVNLLLLHYYYYCYGLFLYYDIQSGFTDRLMLNITKTGFSGHFIRPNGWLWQYWLFH